MKKHILLIALALVFISCRGGMSYKDLDTTDTLAGIDKNNDGIRDDIEKYIEYKYKDEPKKKAAVRQYAKSAQLTTTVDLNDEKEIKKASDAAVGAISCLWEIFKDTDLDSENNPVNVRKEIRSYTTNTEQRLMHYLKYNQKRNGSIIKLPKGSTCHE